MSAMPTAIPRTTPVRLGDGAPGPVTSGTDRNASVSWCSFSLRAGDMPVALFRCHVPDAGPTDSRAFPHLARGTGRRLSLGVLRPVLAEPDTQAHIVTATMHPDPPVETRTVSEPTRTEPAQVRKWRR